MATQENVNFEEAATPNYPVVPGRWAMIWMGNLQEVPSSVHCFQVPFYVWDSEEDLQDKVDEVVALAEAAHPGCPDMKVLVARGSGRWEGQSGIHVEGSV